MTFLEPRVIFKSCLQLLLITPISIALNLTFVSESAIEMDTGNTTRSFEGGTVLKLSDGLHLFTTDETYGIVNTSLVHYHRDITPNSSFKYAGQLICCSTNNPNGADPRASLWAPMPAYDNTTETWHLFYVQYSSAPNNASGWYSNFNGQIAHAVSTTSGPLGVGGPYVDKGIVLAPGPLSQAWEGLQGTDSISPPFMLPNGTYAAFYGSADTQTNSTYKRPHIWWNGLVTSESIGEPYTRITPSAVVNFNDGGSENPIVTQLINGQYITVFDDLHGESLGFGFSWSSDGLNWQTPASVIAVPNGVRTPLAAIQNSASEVSVYYTKHDRKVYEGIFILSNR